LVAVAGCSRNGAPGSPNLGDRKAEGKEAGVERGRKDDRRQNGGRVFCQQGGGTGGKRNPVVEQPSRLDILKNLLFGSLLESTKHSGKGGDEGKRK